MDVGRHLGLEGFTVSCDVFEFDGMLNAEAGCGEGALFGQSGGGERSLRGDILSC